MKAVVLEGLGQMACRDIERPVIGKGEVLLRVRAASICGSDVSRFLKGHRFYPLVLGHEAAGEVVEVGQDVDPTVQGMRAAVIPLIPCMICVYCQHGLFSACENYSFLGSRRAGGFAEFVSLPVANLMPLPAEVDFESSALIEPATVAWHAIKMGKFAPGQSVVVLGAGSVGLMAVQWLRILGARRILVSDLIEENLHAALELGAHIAINANHENVVSRIREETGGGADLALELAGSPYTLTQAIQAARPRGSVVLTGNQPKDATFPAELMETITRKELVISGTWMSYSTPFPGEEWRAAIAAMQSGQLHTHELISHRFPLSQGEWVFQSIAQRSLIYRKILLIP